MKYAWYCTCGAACKGSGDPNTVADLRQIWARFHHRHGHAPTDSKTAAKARTKAEKKARVA